MGFIVRLWVRRGYRGLLDELGIVAGLSRDQEACGLIAPKISGWTIQQHLEHLWRSDRMIVDWLGRVGEGSVTTDGSGFTVPGLAVIWLGRIPRGRGRAPEVTRPAGTTPTEVAEGFEALRLHVERLGDVLDRIAGSSTTRRHPALGCYTAAQWLRFAHIHHLHHRSIIEDIRAAAKSQ